MRLLVVTQKVDSSDPILGFFHRWLGLFAQECEQVIALGQSVGPHDLPANVTVLSLGKERGLPRWLQVLRFWRLVWTHRKEYDAVFVHMTPIWVVLGSPLWKLLGKPVFLWYEVRRGGAVLRKAVRRSRLVFSATEDGLPFKSSNNRVVGHGIDASVFRPGAVPRDPFLLLTIGRVTPIKRYPLVLACLAVLPPPYRLVIGGGPILPPDRRHLAELRAFIAEHGLADRVEIRFLSEAEVIDHLRRARLFLHACGGGLDKVVLEAMACACPILSAAEAAPRVLPPACLATPDTLVLQTLEVFTQPVDASLLAHLRRTIEREHDLPALIARMTGEMRKSVAAVS